MTPLLSDAWLIVGGEGVYNCVIYRTQGNYSVANVIKLKSLISVDGIGNGQAKNAEDKITDGVYECLNGDL